jgi:hypothetical protein
MACWSRQSRNTKALRCCQTNGIAGMAYSFLMTAITPVNTPYAYGRANSSSAGGPQKLPSDCRSWCASRRVSGPQRSLSTA